MQFPNKKIKFSILIPTYNGEKFIAQAIESILNQTRLPDEIIISDDNSTDKTLDICQTFDNPLIKINKNPAGPSGFVVGWRNAIELASFEYISILHQDDILYPQFLEEIENALAKNPDVRHLFAPCDRIDEHKNVISSPSVFSSGEIRRFHGIEYALAYELIPGHLHRCPGVVTHRDIFKTCNYRQEAGHIADDDFFIRVSRYTDTIGILRPLAAYREHRASETGHLDPIRLNRRLVDDYTFQLSDSMNETLVSAEITEIFKEWQSKCLHRLIIFSIRERQWGQAIYGLRKWLCFDNRFGNMGYDLKKLLKKSRRLLEALSFLPARI